MDSRDPAVNVNQGNNPSFITPLSGEEMERNRSFCGKTFSLTVFSFSEALFLDFVLLLLVMLTGITY